MNEITRRCRFCAAPLDQILVDLGTTPLANQNLRAGEEASEQSFPLIARVCGACRLVQVDDSVPPDAIFSQYDYFSSMSTSWVAHAKAYAEAMITRFSLSASSRIVEIASNDGYLLQHFVKAGMPVLGIEPAANVAEVARKAGIETEVLFFGVATARALVARGLSADLIIANNVLAHVPAIADFVSGFATLLKLQGVATFEFPHVLNLIERLQFDTIYHEHFSYLSLLTVQRVFEASGLRVFDVEELSTHGGSLRVFACRAQADHVATPRVDALVARERAAHLEEARGYEGYATRVAAVKAGFLEFLSRAKAEGKTVAAYGAAAKGNTFLNFCGVMRDDIVEVYDRAVSKQTKLLPGTHVPIVAPERMQETKPDYLLILPWNIADEVRRSMGHIGKWGGRFVVAIPEIGIIDP